MSTVRFDGSQHMDAILGLDLDPIISTKLLVSIDITLTNVDGSTRTLIRNRKTATGEFQIIQLSTGSLRMIIKDDTVSTTELCRITTSALAQGTRYAVIFSVDTETGNLVGQSYVNDVASGTDITLAGNIAYNGAPWTMMRNATAGTTISCDISQFRLWEAAAPNLTVEANRRFLFDASNNPAPFANAVAAYGTPLISYTGNANAWNSGVNEGSGNSFTMTGTVTNIGASIDDVNGDEIVMDGSTGNTLEVSGLAGDVTSIKFTSGAFETPALSQAGTGTSYTFAAGDQTSNVDDTAGCPMSSPSWAVAVEASDGVTTGSLAVSRTPKAGWSVVEMVSAQPVTGLFVARPEGAPADTSQVLHDNTATVLPDGNYTVEGATTAMIPFQLFIADTGIWESWLINVNVSNIEDTLSSTFPLSVITPMANTLFDCYCTKVDDQTTVYVQITTDASGVARINDAGLVPGDWNVAFREVAGANRLGVQDYTVA